MKYHHLATIIIISIFFCIVFWCRYNSYATTYAKTLTQIEQTDSLTKDFVKENATIINDTTFKINDVVLNNLDKRQENIEKLLNLQFERLQSEQSQLGIWTAIITIVFLVFSFYSFFHTDDLVKKANEDAEEIKKKLKLSDEIKESFKKELTEIYQPIKQELEEGRDIVNKAKDITNYEERIKNIEDITNVVNTDALEEIKNDIKDLRKRFEELNSEDAPNEQEGMNE